MSDLKTIRGMPDLYGENIEAISMVEEICLKTFKKVITKNLEHLY
jgi:hypothetical protein